jgi:hypothetical protein
MLHLRNGRRRGATATLVAGLTALAVMVVGLGSTGAAAAPASLGERATTISNDLVEIEPAKVKGTFTNPETGKQGRLVAKFMPTEFTESPNGGLAVVGTLTGVFTGAKLPEGTPRHFSEEVTFDVTGAGSPGQMTTAGFQAAGFTPASSHGCDILNLDLGPLDLNLLGLQVDLAPVVLDIVAQPGAGALLGNLLCAVAGLLDGGLGGGLGGLLGSVIDVLNGLLAGIADLQLIADLVGQIQDLLGGLTGTTTAQSV